LKERLANPTVTSLPAASALFHHVCLWHMETKMLVKVGVLFLVSPLHKPNFSVNEWDRGISQGSKPVMLL
jgi:hypothetical protein